MSKKRRLTAWTSLATLLATAWCASPASAQIRFDIQRAASRPEAEAVVDPAQPFGVGRITFELPAEMLPEPLGLEGIGLSEKDGRVLYPALDNPAFAKRMKELLEGNTPLTTGGPVREQVGGLLRGILDRPPRATLYFLFRDAKPLELSLEARLSMRLGPLAPRNDPAAHRRLLQLWWQQYAKPASVLEPKSDYPPVVDNYLTTTLARRLNLRLPQEKQTKPANAELRHEVGFNLGTESLRLAMQQDRILGLNNLNLPADQPLPEPLDSPALEVPEPAAEVQVEPIALRVPAECFYVRFGSFSNFLWLQDTLAKWGGDAQNLIALRGLDRDISGRMEKQLVLKQTVLSRMLGDTIVADVAIIGTDMFFREGASYGLLFHARNNFGLSTNLGQQRLERINAGGVTEQKIKIADHTVSYLASPDGTVRSYYVVDGDFHLVTTSQALVARFLATSAGERALGASREFRHARSIMPLGRGDTVWLYLSDAFFRNITGPHYRLEMARRLQAVADVELVQLAKLTAATEGKPGATVEQLMAASLLPPEFGPLPGGSRAVLDGGEVYDSVRGRRGAFLPVGDVPVDKVTAAEVTEYNRFAEFYRAQWGRMDPVIAGVKRNALKENREQVVVDVLMSPFAPQHFNVLKQWLGPAVVERLAPIPGDMAAMELSLAQQHVFAGLRDMGPQAAAGAAQRRRAGAIALERPAAAIGRLGADPRLPGGLRGHDRPIGSPQRLQHRHSAAIRSGRLCRFVPGRLAAAVRPVHPLLVPARRVGNGGAATPLRAGPTSGPSAVARGRRLPRPDHTHAERSGLWPHAGDLAEQPSFPPRPGPATPRAAGRLPRGGRVPVGRQADLPVGWAIRTARGQRRFGALDVHRPGAHTARRPVGSSRPGGLPVAAVELVSRPRSRRHDDREDHLGPRRDHHADAGEEVSDCDERLISIDLMGATLAALRQRVQNMRMRLC